MRQVKAFTNIYPHLRTKMTQETTSQRIKILIKKLGLTSRAFSASIDVPDATTRNYIDGRSKPSAEYIEKIIRRYAHVNPTWLLTGEGEPLHDEAAEPRALYQKNSGGNNIGHNAAGGRVTQHIAHAHAMPGQSSVPWTPEMREEFYEQQIELLKGQLADKERIIQLLEMQLKK
ncbi:helix-turn-helix domain-containing protein [Hymenobacter pini]|uniref:helix-turn-helix domain-containing protein n=1 Tax=Hymenobacter pini TaxID=2880879 RepID=UPI001CF1E00C|nr:helix-turn-helix transcriptional regulator [Hymenobacter pini]MCA8830567.1 helix-turn-helix domain-containing protein [Hymenobacter pini]